MVRSLSAPHLRSRVTRCRGSLRHPHAHGDYRPRRRFDGVGVAGWPNPPNAAEQGPTRFWVRL